MSVGIVQIKKEVVKDVRWNVGGRPKQKVEGGKLQMEAVNLSQHVEVLEEMLDRLQESMLIFSPWQLAKLIVTYYIM